MPLIHSKSDAAFKQNVKTLMGEVGKSPHVQSRKQALAVAYSTKRRGRDMGGAASPSWIVKAEARNLSHTGPVLSAVPGRTDRHSLNVPSSSYVFPADFVSHLGQNNTMAGMKVLNRMGFNSGPYGTLKVPMQHGAGPPKPPHMNMKLSDQGGGRGEGIGQPTPVVVAGGEYIATPGSIMRVLGTSDIKHAHKTLDHWVLTTRKEHIKQLKSLKPPVKS